MAMEYEKPKLEFIEIDDTDMIWTSGVEEGTGIPEVDKDQNGWQ